MRKVVILFAWWLTVYDFTGGPVTAYVQGNYQTKEACIEVGTTLFPFGMSTFKFDCTPIN